MQAALVQFEGQSHALVRKAEVRTPDVVQSIVEEAAALHAVIFYTLVSDDTRETMKAVSEKLLVPTVDVLGPSFSALHDLFKSAPRHTPGLLYASDRERFDRIDSIDYTLKHDDGQRPHELNEADVVVVGVSRSSKSSTCFYLAYQGIKAANVPLVPGPPLPRQLKDMDPGRVIGLQMNVPRLLTLREARTAHLGTSHTDYYVDRREVGAEVRYANEVIREYGWRTVNASYMAIEEIAREVMRQCGLGPLSRA